MQESKTVEFKSQVSPTFLKTVSAFANEEGGRIYFGIEDDGTIKGVSDPAKIRLSIENAINDGINPRPAFSLETEQLESRSVVVLDVKQGQDCPYLYQGKAYGRSDTSSVALDSAALRKLALRDEPENFEGAPSKLQNLSFETLGQAFQETLGVDAENTIVLKTLGLCKNGVFDNVAALLSDENPFPGIKLVRYDKDGLGIFERVTLDSMSVLSQLTEALLWHKRYYVVERVHGAYRVPVELIPHEAFREAVANALVHRNWLIRGRITISMYDDRIVVVSPGGLPDGVDEQQYLEGDLSVPRNENLAYVLLRLGIIEKLGSGVRRMRCAYKKADVMPAFAVSGSAIRVMLPVVEVITNNLGKNEQEILRLLNAGLSTRENIEQQLGTSRATTTRILKSLVDGGYVERIGQGRATKYKRLV